MNFFRIYCNTEATMRHDTCRRLTAVLTVLCLLLTLFPAMADTPALFAAPISAGGQRSGMVRVYLSSLDNPSKINITVSGSYSVNGDAQRALKYGTKLTVHFNAGTGELALQKGSTYQDMGSGFTLKRHRTEGENGLRIKESYSESNLYPGDLTFKVKASGSTYKLYTIFHVYIEDYLMGVVPYEMGNANPIEALKAQTVAARTYTLRAMQNSLSRDYDVVDTTSDQVYRGTPTGNSNCKKAIEETRGIVSMNGSSLTGTFYTASNGGQIESPRNLWGGSGYAYITVKDDPYDLANPGARVKSFAVNKSGNQGNAVLQQLLDNKAKAFFGTGAKVQGVTAITPHTPKYASPSRLYTKIDFKVNVAVNGTGKTATLTFDIFEELETPLSMSHSSMKNELWTVTETDSGFKVEARRWGHGTGMSQRGAMQMASMGYNYRQILNFYFEGCKLVQYDMTSTILSPVDQGGQEESTLHTAAPVPDGENNVPQQVTLAKVTTRQGGLNLRSEGSSTAMVLRTIPKDTVIEVTSVEGDWCATSYKGTYGYVMTSFLTFIQQDSTSAVTPTPAPEPTDTPAAQWTAKVTTQQGSLNLRAGSSTGHRVLTTIPRGAEIPIYEKGANWCKTRYNGEEGYVMTSFLTFMGTSQTATPAPQVTPDATNAPDDGAARAFGKVTTKQGSLNLREKASGTARVLTTIPRHQVIPLTEVGTVWCRTSYNGFDGYVMTSFLTITIQNPADESGVIATARVTTEKGSLNLRADANASARIIRTIPQYSFVNVYHMDKSWCEVSYEGDHGFVMTKFLTIDEGSMPTNAPTQQPTEAPTATPAATPENTPEITPTPAPTQTPVPADEALETLSAPVLGKTNTQSTVYTGPGVHHDAAFTLPAGDFVFVSAMGDNWCLITWEGSEGYCLRQHLDLPNGY